MSDVLKRGEPDVSQLGNVFYSILEPIIPVIPFENKEQTIAHIRQGRWSFLFDEKGQFVRNSL